MKAVRNRWALRIEVGNAVVFNHPRGGKEEGIVLKIEKEPTGTRITMVSEMTCTPNDVSVVKLVPKTGAKV